MAAEALGVGSWVKVSFLPQNRRGIGDKSNDGTLNCAVLGCAGVCLLATVSV